MVCKAKQSSWALLVEWTKITWLAQTNYYYHNNDDDDDSTCDDKDNGYVYNNNNSDNIIGFWPHRQILCPSTKICPQE